MEMGMVRYGRGTLDTEATMIHYYLALCSGLGPELEHYYHYHTNCILACISAYTRYTSHSRTYLRTVYICTYMGLYWAEVVDREHRATELDERERHEACTILSIVERHLLLSLV